MPFAVHMDERTKVLHIRAVDEVSDAELMDLSERVRQHPAFIAGCPILYDTSAVKTITFSSDLVHSLARAARADKNPVAVIAPSAAAFGLARMFQIVSDVGTDRVGVFADASDALAWLAALAARARDARR